MIFGSATPRRRRTCSTVPRLIGKASAQVVHVAGWSAQHVRRCRRGGGPHSALGRTAYVSEYPSSEWAPVLQANGTVPVDSSTHFARAIPGSPSAAGNVLVLASGNDVRIGTYTPSGSTYRLLAFRIASATPVADVQLVQTLPSGRVLVVFSVYTDTDHEYEAVVVDPSGALVDQFSLPAFDWAQSTARRASGLSARRCTSSGTTIRARSWIATTWR